MSVKLKLNQRIKIIDLQENQINFLIDNKKKSTFFSDNEDLKNHMLKFINDGCELYELANLFNFSNLNELRLLNFIQNLEKFNFIEYHFNFDDPKFCIISPIHHSFINSIYSCFTENYKNNLSSQYLFSRFTFFKIYSDLIIIESPRSKIRLSIHIDLFHQILNVFTKKLNVFDVFVNFKLETIIFYKFLEENNIIHSPTYSEPSYLQTWEFHDLLFHSESRLGRADDSINFGGTYRFLNLTSPPSNSKNTNFKNFITLPKPDMNNLLKNDLSFTQILENRRSYRKFENGEGLNKALLGDFLYRSVGVRKVGKNSLQDAIYKPFPSAGALHEIEFYLVINNSQDFNKDIYFYDSCKNTLHGLEVKEKYIKKIISNARTAMGRDSSFPDALVVLTSRFGKNAWKYQKIAYRCTLITVGAIFQTMSLVASALNIGSCVIGSGDPYLFGEATNIPLLEEGTVGEFALGAISSV